MSIDDFDGLAAMLDRARHGDGKVRLIGETTVRDVPVHELRIEYTVQVTDWPSKQKRPATASRTVYLDRERFLPVRIVDDMIGLVTTTDDFDLERLPRTPGVESDEVRRVL